MDECFHYDRFCSKFVGAAFMKKKSQKLAQSLICLRILSSICTLESHLKYSCRATAMAFSRPLPVFALDAFDAGYIGIIGVVQVCARYRATVIFFG